MLWVGLAKMERSWNVICDVCGFKYKNHQLKKRWDGLIVCEEDFESRHPQDFAKIPRTEKAIPWARPEKTDTFVDVDYISSSEGVQETTIPSGHFNNGL